MTNIPLIVSLAFVSGLATLIGVILGTRFSFGKRGIAFGTAFAAIMMVLISVFELIPEGYDKVGFYQAGFFVLLGLGIIFLINILAPHLHTVEEFSGCDDKCLLKASILIMIGLIIHDFPEGLAISGSFKSEVSLGLTVFAAALLHNIPEGYALTVASDSFKGDGFFYRAGLLSGLSTMLGAILGVVLLSQIQNLEPYLLLITAGIMVFISIHELLPLSYKNHHLRWSGYGALASIAAFFLLDYIF